MFTLKKASFFFSLIATILIANVSAISQEYIVMGTPRVNIRTGPSTNHFIIGRAEKGDIFKVIETEDNWHTIAMFSGDHRYIFAADYVYPLTKEDLVPGHKMELSNSEKLHGSICSSIREAKSQAKTEANEIIPTFIDESRNTAFRNILEDRIMLERMHIYSFQPKMYNELIKKCKK